MTSKGAQNIRSADVVVPCEDLTRALAFYVDELGFRLDLIFPADAPRVAVISGYGVRLRLDESADTGCPALHFTYDGESPRSASDTLEQLAPDGMRIQFSHESSALKLPPLASTLVVQKANDAKWRTGRAGMQYRDLIPGRLGGRYIASHIQIPKGGSVPDYVHHHRIQFQMIYCYRGWVRVVYEDQGPAFKMQAGDCVLQPPQIRHRVLESSDGMEVIEISCPAEHLTLVDHEMDLPTASLQPERDFCGQRFVYSQSVHSAWLPGPYAGFHARDLGLATATRGFASARILRSRNAPTSSTQTEPECLFSVILHGSAELDCGPAQQWGLSAGDAFVIPAHTMFSLRASSPDLEMLQVSLK